MAILTQSRAQTPVLCFETDGHVNIEAKCDVSCKVSTPIDDTHQDNCYDCIDIQLWNYNPDLAFTIHSNKLDNIDFEFIQPIILLQIVPEIQSNFHPIETNLLQLPPLIKTTILII